MRSLKPMPPSRRAGTVKPNRTAGALLGLGLFALLVPEPASAQFFGPGPGFGLPPFAVRRIMQGQGFRVLAPPFRRGDVYVVDAVDGYGRQVRAIVDAYEGTIIQSFGVRGRVPPPGRPVVAGERLPFPGETRFPEGARGDGRGQREESGGLFGLFPRSSPPARPVPAERIGEPRVVPGLGPDKAKPHHLVRPKPPPRAVVRATPAPPPLPGPQVIPAPTPAPSITKPPTPAKAATAPPPPAAPAAPAPVAKREVLPPAAAPSPPPKPAEARVAPKPNEARTPAAPKPSEALAPAAPKPSEAHAPAPKPSEALAPAAPKPSEAHAPAPKPKETQANASPKPAGDKPAPPKVGAAKKKSGPLNDIPPAPLE